jgi:hypothetical protein
MSRAGQSCGTRGNRQGRPKGSRNTKTDLAEILDEKVKVKIGGKVRKRTKRQAMLLAAVNKGLNGDVKAIANVLNLAERLGLNDRRADDTPLGAQDEAIIAAAIKRATEL